MNARSNELVLPDANILVHLLRGNKTGERIEAQHSLTARKERPILSSIVEGELLALARYREWGQSRTAALKELLTHLVRVDAGHPDVVKAYVDLYCEAHRVGRYRQFRQNDLWIASTARAAGAVLYTCNGKDFDWIDPQYLEIVSVETVP